MSQLPAVESIDMVPLLLWDAPSTAVVSEHGEDEAVVELKSSLLIDVLVAEPDLGKSGEGCLGETDSSGDVFAVAQETAKLPGRTPIFVDAARHGRVFSFTFII